MNSLLTVILLGFFLGLRHASDPDHVIAVTTIVSQHRKVSQGAAIGMLWGLGHTVTIVIVGFAMILFGVVIPPRLGLSMEFGVALMLIVLGGLTLNGIVAQAEQIPQQIAERERRPHAHLHSIDASGGERLHPHRHDGEESSLHWLDHKFGRRKAFQLFRPLLVGIVHGMAGSAAITLLVLATIQSPAWAMIYLLVFGAGTIAGMMLITAVIALPFAYGGDRLPRLHRYLRVGSAIVSVGFGIVLGYQIGVVHGLFTSHPQWTPR